MRKTAKLLPASVCKPSAGIARHLAGICPYVRDLGQFGALSIPKRAGRHSPTGWPKPHVRTSTLLIIIRVRVCVTLAHCTYVRIGWHQHLTTVFPKSLCKTPLTNGMFCYNCRITTFRWFESKRAPRKAFTCICLALVALATIHACPRLKGGNRRFPIPQPWLRM